MRAFRDGAVGASPGQRGRKVASEQPGRGRHAFQPGTGSPVTESRVPGEAREFRWYRGIAALRLAQGVFYFPIFLET